MYSKSSQVAKITQRKTQKKKNKTWYATHMDAVFSQLIRARDGKCLRCGKTISLQCSHIASRKHLAGRWNDQNAITLCYRCHIHWAHKEPIEFSEWLKEVRPDFWRCASEVKKTQWKPSLEEYQALYENLQQKLILAIATKHTVY